MRAVALASILLTLSVGLARAGSGSGGMIALTCEACNGGSGGGEVWAIHPNGRRIGLLFEATGTVRFSPDGTQIAYATSGRIHVRSTAGTRDVALTDPPGHPMNAGDSDPAWLDGRTLVFVRAREQSPGSNITSLETISTHPTRPAGVLFATTPSRDPLNVDTPDVSRNGTIVFAGDGEGHLWTMRRRRWPQPLAWSDPTGYSPRWSPDGTRVAFLRSKGASADFVPEIVDVLTGRIRTLSVSGDQPSHASALAWSPDGRQLAVAVFHSYACGEPQRCNVDRLWIVDLKSAVSHKVFTTPEGGSITAVDWTG